jgi:Mitochondrial carrier protein
MYRDQGISGFYRGVNVNVMRAIVLNATNMGVYDVAKGRVVESTGWSRKDPRTAFFSSFLAGFFMTCTVAPFDRVRTKLMNQPTNQKVYNGMADCLVKTVTNEGPLSLWRGFIPMYVAANSDNVAFYFVSPLCVSLVGYSFCSWARFAPMATIQLLTLETLYSTFGFKSI